MIFESQIIDQRYLSELAKSKKPEPKAKTEPKFVVQDSEAVLADVPEEDALKTKEKEKVKEFKS